MRQRCRMRAQKGFTDRFYSFLIHTDENEITGSIPITIGYLTALQTVVLGNNMITGTLPRDLSGLTKLHQLDLRKYRPSLL